MAQNDRNERGTEPRGFGEHTRGLSAEYAHEQGWGIEVEQRSRLFTSPQETDSGDPTQNKAGKKE